MPDNLSHVAQAMRRLGNLLDLLSELPDEEIIGILDRAIEDAGQVGERLRWPMGATYTERP